MPLVLVAILVGHRFLMWLHCPLASSTSDAAHLFDRFVFYVLSFVGIHGNDAGIFPSTPDNACLSSLLSLGLCGSGVFTSRLPQLLSRFTKSSRLRFA